MVKGWIIEANSSVGGLIEKMKDCCPSVKIEIHECVDNPLFWVMEVCAPVEVMAALENEIAPYM